MLAAAPGILPRAAGVGEKVACYQPSSIRYTSQFAMKREDITRHHGSSQRIAHSMRALGKADLPPAIQLEGGQYRLVQTVKHDFYAATGFYENHKGHRVVLKVSRTEEFAGFPLHLLGEFLCRREARFYSRLCDVAGIPRLLGTWGQSGLVLEYVPGQTLCACDKVPDGWFSRLQGLFEQVHLHDIAHVDANKTQNILVGDDGKPYLIDFQISYSLADFGDFWLSRRLLRHLQGSDIYHILKHKRRRRPDELTRAEREQSLRMSLPIRMHRLLLKFYWAFRRPTLQRMRQAGQLLPEGSK